MPIALVLAAVVATAPLVQDSTRAPRTAADSAAAQALSAVRVSAERAARTQYRVSGTRSSTRTLTPLREVPQSITVLGPQVMRDLGLQTMARAMEYVPGVTMGQGEGHRDAPTIRGQSTTADFFVDGVRDDAQYFRDSYNVSQIEALKGARGKIVPVPASPGWIDLHTACSWRIVRRCRVFLPSPSIGTRARPS